jgi:galactokinase
VTSSAEHARLHREAFGRASDLAIVRAPGRVNLIGEHVDYCDLPVLPMAIQREIRWIIAPRADARVRLVNRDPRFEGREFELSNSIEPAPAGDWSNYVRAAGQMLCQRLGRLRGLDAFVEGDIPPAAGLSSSSAMVVAAALALLHVNERELPRLELAAMCAAGERYVGTNSGGMDQAVCLLGRAGHAIAIEFAPLRAQPIAIPHGWSFVVAHSGVPADKSGAARELYNDRRAACEEALQRVGSSPDLPESVPSYPELVEAIPLEPLLAIGRSSLERALLRRFRHVVTEADRVLTARAALANADARGFGDAMNASHTSLRDDFEVSSPALDRLVELARSYGALGARLTGAGFGGCIVAYTAAPGPSAAQLRDDLAPHSPEVFVAEAGAGARIDLLE